MFAMHEFQTFVKLPAPAPCCSPDARRARHLQAPESLRDLKQIKGAVAAVRRKRVTHRLTRPSYAERDSLMRRAQLIADANKMARFSQQAGICRELAHVAIRTFQTKARPATANAKLAMACSIPSDFADKACPAKE